MGGDWHYFVIAVIALSVRGLQESKSLDDDLGLTIFKGTASDL
jgi:hypothetical protein